MSHLVLFLYYKTRPVSVGFVCSLAPLLSSPPSSLVLIMKSFGHDEEAGEEEIEGGVRSRGGRLGIYLQHHHQQWTFANHEVVLS